MKKNIIQFLDNQEKGRIMWKGRLFKGLDLNETNRAPKEKNYKNDFITYNGWAITAHKILLEEKDLEGYPDEDI